MIYKHTIIKTVAGFAGVATLVAGFALSASAAGTTNSSAALTRIIARSDTAITTRINSLNTLAARIAGMKNVTAAEQASLSSEVQTQISDLTTLKAKIDADTDIATARTDAKTITDGYRIYAMVIPRGYIVASSDRVTTIVGLMNTIQAKLQARITTAQTAGKDVSALQTAMTDMTAKLSDATTQATNAQSSVVLLVPDQGSTTIASSNKAAIQASRADIKTATSDLKTVRTDIQTIMNGLKAVNTTH